MAHNVRNAAGTKFVVRKGETLEAGHVDDLRALSSRELHLLEIAPDELHENEAGARLARAVAGPGINVKGPSESQYTLAARHRGLLRIDEQALCQVNDLDGLSVLTRFDYQAVDQDEPLAGAKVTPLAIPRSTIERVEEICGERPPLRVLPFVSKRVAALVLERVDVRARERFHASLEAKLAWFGSELVTVRESNGASYASLMREVLQEDPDLIMAAGASSLDPLEPLFGALNDLGAQVVKHGVPVHPGSLFWLAYLGPVPVFGLSSCEMFSHKTILDLILPRLFAGEPVGREELVKLGHGGMLGREMSFRFPNYDGAPPSSLS